MGFRFQIDPDRFAFEGFCDCFVAFFKIFAVAIRRQCFFAPLGHLGGMTQVRGTVFFPECLGRDSGDGFQQKCYE
jgi:hypothetical protein